MLLRESSLSTILEQDGKKRSSKAIAPTQTESDRAAYGSRKAKAYGASLQVEAWDENARLISGLMCNIGTPMSKEWRDRGEFGDPSWLRQYLSQQQSDKFTTDCNETHAKRKLEEASSSSLTERARNARV